MLREAAVMLQMPYLVDWNYFCVIFLITGHAGNTSSQVQATLQIHEGQIRIGPKAKVGQLVSMTENRGEPTLIYSDILSYSIWLPTSNIEDVYIYG